MTTSPLSDLSTARALHQRAIIVDGHCDTPYRLKRMGIGIADADTEAQLDLQLLRESGITGSFFAAYVPPFYAGRGAARFAFDLIDIIHREVARHPDRLIFAGAAETIREAKANDLHAILIGVEGGHAIEDSLETLEALYERGARYLTLTHVNTNNWCDSSGDAPRHGGLTEFGRSVVRRMNDLGMLVDISHVSDAAFYAALETSRAPIIASHSSCRALTNHPRNMSDDMLRALAAKGGICMINFFSAFINEEVSQALQRAQKRDRMESPPDNDEVPDDRTDWASYLGWFQSLGVPTATIDDAADHIVHAAKVAGVEHVGIGSDFDGVPALPHGLTDASLLPDLTERLLDRGLGESEVEMILGENFLRVFEAVERFAE
jgi:membrane dipeptidase